MNLTSHVKLMASYNAWMNVKLYEAARRLTDEQLLADRNAFFGSISGTLNHLVVADTIWLKRFATHPADYLSLDEIRHTADPKSLDQLLLTDFQSLNEYRIWLDRIISEWVLTILEPDLLHSLQYSNTKGIAMEKNFFSLMMHFFNHQTHHRGQVTTLLTQAGIDVGVTDLVALIP
jgi:uncharacterized damage-inducible protein DinB